MQWMRGEYVIDTDHSRLDLDVIHGFLTGSYWATGIPRETVERSVEHSVCFGLYHETTQVGFARAITDHATFAYISDVFILESYRGHGLGNWLIATVLSHPALGGLRRCMLATADAHEVYRAHGFTRLASPDIFMERADAEHGA